MSDSLDLQYDSNIDNSKAEELAPKKSLIEFYNELPESSIQTNRGSNLELKKYQPYVGGMIDPYDSDLEQKRAEGQSTGAKIFGTLNKALVGEVIGGSIEGIGHLTDVKQSMDALNGTTQEWGNWMTDLGKSMRTWAEEATPVYLDPATEGKFDPLSSDWWYRNAPSMASTLSLMIPAAGVVKGASLLGKAMGLASKVGKVPSFLAKGIGQATVSRLMENGMEALGNYEQTYNQLLADGRDEETAKRVASDAASSTWGANWVMLAQDIPQYLMLNKAFGSATEDVTTGMAKKLGQSIMAPITKKGAALAKDAAGEALEEGYQFITSEESRNLAEVRAGIKDESVLDDRLKGYLKDDELYTSMMMGALGSTAMQTLGKPLNNAITRIKGEETVEQKRINNIGSWAAERSKYAADIKKYRDSGNVYGEEEASNNLITSMGVQAAEMGNLGTLRETLRKVAEEGDKASMELLGVSKEELPNVKKDFANYDKKLGRIEELYNNYKKSNIDNRLVPVVVQMQSKLETKNDLKTKLSKEVDELRKGIPRYDEISDQYKAKIDLEVKKESLGKVIKTFENNLKAKEKDIESLKANIANETDEDIKKTLESNLKMLESDGFVSNVVLEQYRKVNDEVNEKLKEANNAYTKDIKAKDDFIGVSKDNYISFTNKHNQLTMLESDIDNLQQHVNKYKSKEFGAKFKEATQLKDLKTLSDYIKKATTLQELEEVKKQTAGNKKAEKAFDTAVKKAAATQTIDESDGDGLFDEPTKKAAPKFSTKYSKENAALLLTDRSEIVATVRELLPDLDDPDWMRFEYTNNTSDMDTAMENIYSKSESNAQMGAIANIVDDFFAIKKDNRVNTLKEQDTTQAVEEFEEGATDEQEDVSEILRPKFERGPKEATIWESEMYYVPETEGWEVFHPKGSKEPVMQKHDIADYDPDLVNTPGKFGTSTEVFFEVDPQSSKDFTPEKVGMNDMAVQVVTYENGKRIVLTLLPAISSSNAKYAEDFEKLVDIREQLYKAWNESENKSDIVKLGFKSIIEQKHAGRIWRTDTYYTPDQVVNGTDTPIVFGVVTNKGGEKILDVPYAPNDSYRTISGDHLKVGAVYQLLPMSNGEIIPFRVFTQKVGKFTKDGKNKYADEIYKEIQQLAKKNTPESTKAAIANIQKTAFVRLEFKDGNIILHNSAGTKKVELSKDGINANDKATEEQFKQFIYDVPVQVDINQINRSVGKQDYNDIISKEGRLTINVRPKRWSHSTRFTVNLDYIVSETPKVIDNTPEVKPPFVEPNVEITSAPEGVDKNAGKVVITSPFGVPSDEAIESEESFYNPEDFEVTPKEESDAVSEEVKQTSSKKRKLLSDKNKKHDVGGEKFRKVTEDTYEVWDSTKELEWFKKNFPQVKIGTVEGLLKTGNSSLSWGQFVDGMVLISSQAKTGTVYHEAFHTVFNLFLTDKQQQEILTQAKERFGDLTNEDLEEELSDALMDYVITDGLSTKSLGQKILDFFQHILDIIKYELFRNPDIDRVFRLTHKGYFSKKNPVRKYNGIKDRIVDLTVKEQFERTENIANAIKLSIDALGLKGENLNKTRKQIVKQYGIDAILKGAYVKLAEYHDENIDTLTDYQETQFEIMFREFLAVDENGELPEGKVTVKTLGINALELIAQSEGVKLILDNKISMSNIDSAVDSDTVEIDEEEDALEGWQIKVEQLSAADRAVGKMRSELSYIPLLDKKGKIVRDSLGIPKYVPFKKAFATILKEMSELTTYSAMKAQFDELVKVRPEYKYLQDKLENDNSLQTLFFQSFQNTHADFKIMEVQWDEKKQTNTIKWYSSNRQGVVKSMIDSWRNNYDDPQYNVLVGKTDLSKDKENYEEFRLLLSKDASDANLETFAKLLNSVGITVEVDELKLLREIKSKKYGNLFNKFRINIGSVLNKYFEGKNPFEGQFVENQSLENAANSLKSVRPQLQESSFMSVDKKKIYSHIIPNFISKQTKKILDPTVRAKYKQNPFYQGMPWFEQMDKNPGFYEENFNFVMLDGFKEDGVGTKYEKLNKRQLSVLNINAFLNNNNKENLAYYQMPILSDAPNGVWVQAEKFTNDDVIDFLYDVSVSEWNRIQYVEKLSDKGVEYKNYSKNGKFFAFLPILNSHKKLFVGNPDLNKDAIKNIIKTHLDEEVGLEKAEFEKLGVTTKGNSTLISKEHSYPDMDSLIKNYVYNDFLAKTQLVAIYQGDPAWYKNTVDFFKRAKEVLSPGLMLNTEAVYELTEEQAAIEDTNRLTVKPVYTTKYIEDVEYYSPLGTTIFEQLEGKVSEEDRYEIASRYGYSNDVKDGKPVAKVGDKVFESKKVNVTDAQAFISLRRYREIQIGLGRWDKDMQDAFWDIKRGINSEAASKVSFNPIKPFVFTHNIEGDLPIPTQNKNSEFLVLPGLAYLTVDNKVVLPTAEDRLKGYPNYKSPVMARVLDEMERDSYGDTEYVDSIQFVSAVKVGEYGADTVDNIDKATPHYLSNSDFRLQQETPEHFVDDYGLIGTQLRKLILGDITPGLLFNIGDVSMTSEEVIAKYHEVVSADVNKSMLKVLDKLAVTDAKILDIIPEKYFDILAPQLKKESTPEQDEAFQKWLPGHRNLFKEWEVRLHNKIFEDIQEVLLEEVRSRNMGDQMKEALELRTDGEGFKRFALPLFHPLQSKRTESLLGSIFKSEIVKQKAPGGALVQASGVGYTNELKVIIENGAIVAYECYMPWWSSEYFKPLMDTNGNLDINKLPEDLRDAVGYRIPTEDKYSMVPLRIKGFLPKQSGEAIMLPPEITVVMGSDFDVDKLYVHLSQYTINEASNMEDRVLETDLNIEFSKEDLEEAEKIMNYCKNKKFGR